MGASEWGGGGGVGGCGGGCVVVAVGGELSLIELN